MTLQELLSDAERMKAYQEWRDLPLTKAMYDVTRELARPVSLNKPVGDAALYALGMYVGFSQLQDVMFRADQFLLQQKAAAEAELIPDYNAAELVRKLKEGDLQ